MPRRRAQKADPLFAVILLIVVMIGLATAYPTECLSVAGIGIGAGIIYLVAQLIEAKRAKDAELYSDLNRIQAQHLAWNTARLGALNPYEFERVVTTLYGGMGYQARHTGRAGDNGVDILVYDKHGDKHVVQCKHKTVGNVGAGAIRDLIGTIAREKAVTGVLCTNADYTQPARDTASGHPVLLYNGEDIVRQLNLIEQKTKMTNGASDTRKKLDTVIN